MVLLAPFVPLRYFVVHSLKNVFSVSSARSVARTWARIAVRHVIRRGRDGGKRRAIRQTDVAATSDSRLRAARIVRRTRGWIGPDGSRRRGARFRLEFRTADPETGPLHPRSRTGRFAPGGCRRTP